MLGHWRVGTLLSLGLAGLMLAGCDKATETSSTTETSDTANSANSNTSTGADGKTAGSADGKKYKIVFIPMNTGNPYFDAVKTGFEKSSEELGYEFSTVAPAAAEAASQIPFIKEQAQQGVDAIVIAPNSPDAPVPALKEAKAKGIKIITVDADLTGNEGVRDAGILPMDFNITGKSQIELMSSLINGQGDFAILSATTDAPNQNFWIKGMKETLKDPKYKGMKLVEVVYGNDEPQKSLREAEGLLTKYPNLKGIIAPTTVGVAAAARAVENANAADRVQVTGLGTPDQMRSFIKKGTVKKFALWDPADMGYIAGHLIVGMLKGEIKPAPGVSFKAGSFGEKKVTDKNVIIAGQPLIFDKNNIEKYHF